MINVNAVEHKNYAVPLLIPKFWFYSTTFALIAQTKIFVAQSPQTNGTI